MIRFINISDQITEDEFQFAWYDTVCDRFMDIEGKQVWTSWKEFARDYSISGHTYSAYALHRFRSLYPSHLIDKAKNESK